MPTGPVLAFARENRLIDDLQCKVLLPYTDAGNKNRRLRKKYGESPSP
jgi:hypothetical protein